MSQVAGGEAIFEEKCVFSLCGQKKDKMWAKSGKMFNYVTFLMFSKKRWWTHLMT